jgi:hypothetical protein
METPAENRDQKRLADEEAEAAAAEAGRIGGEVQQDTDDPAEAPLIEAGQGEAEGFELAEKDLADIAEHGDEHNFPDNVPSAAEEPSGAEYGEPDEAIPADE